MREPRNITDIAALRPDFIGLIFYPKSPRYVSENSISETIPEDVRLIGVFVDETPEKMLETAKRYSLHGIQLHGEESPETCRIVRENGLLCIKAFSIGNREDFSLARQYVADTDYFLFDTKTETFGGSGMKFDWDIIGGYSLSRPFLLGGGIGPEDAERLRQIAHPRFAGADINSRFETAPAIKDMEKVKQFIKIIRK
jgi:phosphoribosylanthranilate isomerase